MSSKRFLTSRTFLIQIAIAVRYRAFIIFICMKGLENYTRHGQSHPVPDFQE
jgi:eukaryotic-like serine/threonine-protein kinase